jgi:ankyrin repeat protein
MTPERPSNTDPTDKKTGHAIVPDDTPTPRKLDLNPEQQSAFNDVLREGIDQQNIDMIKLALEKGAEPNILMFAGIAHKLPSLWERFIGDNHGLVWVQLAVQFGADVNATNPALLEETTGKPYTAIHCAYQNFGEDITDFLIAKGASVDTPSPPNNTPLMRSVFFGNTVLVRYYLSKGADPIRLCNGNLFPLKALQASDKFTKEQKAELLTLMMEHVRPAAAQSTPAADFNAAVVDVGLPHDIEVQRPLSLKPPSVKPGPHFKL